MDAVAYGQCQLEQPGLLLKSGAAEEQVVIHAAANKVLAVVQALTQLNQYVQQV